MGPHDVLGVRSGATRREVVDAFRRFALCHHPDRGGDPSRFQAGLDAYRQLTRSRGLRPPGLGGGTGVADVVFHRRARPSVPALLRVTGRRIAAFRFRP